MTTAYIGLGSNMGDRKANLATSLELLGREPGINIIRTSSVYETSPWGLGGQPDFLNQAAEADTVLNARQLLEAMLRIEDRMGRTRERKWGPRLIDLDLLLFGGETCDTPFLVLPHPYLTQRLFVLIPLFEIAPGLILPDGTPLQKVLDNYDKSLRNGCVRNLSVLKCRQNIGDGKE